MDILYIFIGNLLSVYLYIYMHSNGQFYIKVDDLGVSLL